MADQEALLRVLRSFARTMAGSYDVPHVLHELSEDVAEILGATAAGVALCDGDDLRFVTATSEAAAAAEEVQERLQSGPCSASICHGEPVPVGDLRERHQEWPEYVPAVERTGFRAVLAVPLVLDERRVGSLDVYNAEPRVWTDEAVSAASALADIAAAFVLNASDLAQAQRTSEQLQTALDSRVLIEQAKGVLAERTGITPNDAFNQIRTHARANNATVRSVCTQIIESGFVPR